jgi:hypothetical protein
MVTCHGLYATIPQVFRVPSIFREFFHNSLNSIGFPGESIYQEFSRSIRTLKNETSEVNKMKQTKWTAKPRSIESAHSVVFKTALNSQNTMNTRDWWECHVWQQSPCFVLCFNWFLQFLVHMSTWFCNVLLITCGVSGATEMTFLSFWKVFTDSRNVIKCRQTEVQRWFEEIKSVRRDSTTYLVNPER